MVEGDNPGTQNSDSSAQGTLTRADAIDPPPKKHSMAMAWPGLVRVSSGP